MGPQERQEFIDKRKLEITSSFDNHIAVIERLAHDTNFDFDVASDIHPKLLDETTREGRGQLVFWQKLYSEFENQPRYTVITRLSSGLAPGCYGFGQEAKFEVNSWWVRIFKDLTPDKLKFIKGDSINGSTYSEVLIDHPSVLVENDTFLQIDSPVTLFTERPSEPQISSSQISSRVTRELYNKPIITYGDNIAFALVNAHQAATSYGRENNFSTPYIGALRHGEAAEWYQEQLTLDRQQAQVKTV